MADFEEVLVPEHILGSWTVDHVDKDPGVKKDLSRFFIVGGAGKNPKYVLKKYPLLVAQTKWNGKEEEIELQADTTRSNGITYVLKANVDYDGSNDKLYTLRLGSKDVGETLEINVSIRGGGGGGTGKGTRP